MAEQDHRRPTGEKLSALEHHQHSDDGVTQYNRSHKLKYARYNRKL
jgi:hypothetical protein